LVKAALKNYEAKQANCNHIQMLSGLPSMQTSVTLPITSTIFTVRNSFEGLKQSLKLF